MAQARRRWFKTAIFRINNASYLGKNGDFTRLMGTITQFAAPSPGLKIAFQRSEMSVILDIYGRLVMSGQAKDYAIGMHKDQAVFAIFRRHADNPTWQVVKTPALARAQGAYAVIGAQGQVLKRGKELKQVLRVFETRRFEVVS